MKIRKSIPLLLITSTLIVISSLNASLNANTKYHTKNTDDIAYILNHLIKNEFKRKGNKSITMNKSVTIYNLNRGLIDSVVLDLSMLKLADPRIVFSNHIPDTVVSLQFKRINYFTKSNKYELKAEQIDGVMGGHEVSYVYKKRKGLFKRWVYKRYVGRIWCGSF